MLRRRVDALGVAEPSITQSGDRRIIVELPGVHDPRQAAAVLGRTAQLTFHPVRGVPPPDGQPGPPGRPGQPARPAGAGGRGRASRCASARPG